MTGFQLMIPPFVACMVLVAMLSYLGLHVVRVFVAVGDGRDCAAIAHDLTGDRGVGRERRDHAHGVYRSRGSAVEREEQR